MCHLRIVVFLCGCHEKEVCVAKKAMNILIWETKQLNQIKCDQCDSWFDRKSQLEKHTQELHNQNSTKHTIDRKPSLQKIDLTNQDDIA